MRVAVAPLPDLLLTILRTLRALGLDIHDMDIDRVQREEGEDIGLKAQKGRRKQDKNNLILIILVV